MYLCTKDLFFQCLFFVAYFFQLLLIGKKIFIWNSLLFISPNIYKERIDLHFLSDVGVESRRFIEHMLNCSLCRNSIDGNKVTLHLVSHFISPEYLLCFFQTLCLCLYQRPQMGHCGLIFYYRFIIKIFKLYYKIWAKG